MKKIKFALFIIIAFTVCLIVYSFLFGKLFPYSPIIIGFTKQEYENTVVYVQKGTVFTDITIDSLVPVVENVLDLKFPHKPRIFIFRDNSSYMSRSMTKARFCAFYNGSIVISPWALREAQDGSISLKTYLKHELSHSLIHQHAGLINAMKYPKWLHEGIAMYTAEQMGTSWYPDKEETYNYIRQGNFMPPDFYQTKKAHTIKLDVPNRITFIYSEFACIVDYLIYSYGKEKFLHYMKRLLKAENHDQVFEDVFQTGFKEFIVDFKKHVSKSAVLPGN